MNSLGRRGYATEAHRLRAGRGCWILLPQCNKNSLAGGAKARRARQRSRYLSLYSTPFQSSASGSALIERLMVLNSGERLALSSMKPIWSWATSSSAKMAFAGRSGTHTAQSMHSSGRSEEHTSELQSLMRISYAVFCLKKTNKSHHTPQHH